MICFKTSWKEALESQRRQTGTTSDQTHANAGGMKTVASSHVLPTRSRSRIASGTRSAPRVRIARNTPGGSFTPASGAVGGGNHAQEAAAGPALVQRDGGAVGQDGAVVPRPTRQEPSGRDIARSCTLHAFLGLPAGLACCFRRRDSCRLVRD